MPTTYPAKILTTACSEHLRQALAECPAGWAHWLISEALKELNPPSEDEIIAKLMESWDDVKVAPPVTKPREMTKTAPPKVPTHRHPRAALKAPKTTPSAPRVLTGSRW